LPQSGSKQETPAAPSRSRSPPSGLSDSQWITLSTSPALRNRFCRNFLFGKCPSICPHNRPHLGTPELLKLL
jgi:hypothetical protein